VTSLSGTGVTPPRVPTVALDLAVDLAPFTLQVRAELPPGVTAVMGPSGAGKTSLLEAIAGLRRARGRVAVGDTVLFDSGTGVFRAPEHRRVGYVPQDAGLFPHLSALDNVRFGSRADAAAVDAALDTLELAPLLRRRPRSLSGGERQRVALARALAIRPRMLLLDEPLAALDPGLRERILPWLLRVRDAWSLPCLYVTHNVGEALTAASHLLLLRGGRLEAAGEPRALLAAAALVEPSEAGIENLVPGRVVAHDEGAGVTRVRADAGYDVSISLALSHPAGAAVTLAVRAEDVLVCARPVEGLSARNVYAARVAALDRTGPDVTLRCALDEGGAELLARVTPAAVAALEVRVDARVWLAVKSHSVRVL